MSVDGGDITTGPWTYRDIIVSMALSYNRTDLVHLPFASLD
jgi:hypothetical protein